MHGSGHRRAERSLHRLSVVGLVLALVLPTSASSSEVISSSKNFEQIGSITIPGVVVSGALAGDTFFASSWQSGLYSYDVSDPTAPKFLDQMGDDQLLMQEVENEEMVTDGKILLLSRFFDTTTSVLYVIDVSDPKNMKIEATLDGAGAHTYTCLDDCKWAYGTVNGLDNRGIILDLHDPSNPKLLDKPWTDAIDGTYVHDVTEVHPGLVLTSSTPMYAMDTTDPTKPRTIMKTDPGTTDTSHNNIWPRSGKDRFMISASEAVNEGRCEPYGDDGKTLQVWRTDGWRTKGFRRVGSYTLVNGTGSDGQPPLDVFGIQGCSAHWAREHPSFHNGGLVAMAAYSHGVRLLDISSQGIPREVGWFLKDIQAAIDVTWLTDRIMYVVEDGSGGAIDIVKYTGPLP